MKQLLKGIRHFFRILSIMAKELLLCTRYTGFISKSNRVIKWRLLLLAHSIEKGLSICDTRPDFGEKKAKDLLALLILSKAQQSDGINMYEYSEAVSVLKAYRQHRVEHNLDIEFLKDIDSVIDYNTQSFEAGFHEIDKNQLLCKPELFLDLCKKRHSVREYADYNVSDKDIIKALNIVQLAPSACNRQMIKVFFSPKADANRVLADYIPGNSGTRDEKAVYLFICVDRTAFDYYEVFQWYLNGGIFSAYLSLALTSNNIANCIYQWPNNYHHNKEVKASLNIPQSMEIVSVISAGHYKEMVKVLSSARKSVEEYYCESY